MFDKCKTKEEAKTLFRKLSMKLHPDHGGDHELFIKLKESFDNFKPTASSKPHKNYSDFFDYNIDPDTDDRFLEIIEDILYYAENINKKFNPDFTLSMLHLIEQGKILSDSQEDAILNIYTKFKVEEKIKEYKKRR